MQDRTRRDAIFIATGAIGMVGLAGMSVPLWANMNPATDTKVADGVYVDLSKIPPGQQIKITYRGNPIIVRHRTAREIAMANAVDVDKLIDPETDVERLSPHPDGSYSPEFLVVSGVCTHFGCALRENKTSDKEGWFCPCHGARYDTSGRVLSGPAVKNLPVPEYHYLEDNLILITDLGK